MNNAGSGVNGAVPDAREIGKMGEDAACEWLESRGFEVVHRNWRVRAGEIDVIARRQGLTVFVEVKARRGVAFGMPEESVTPAKARRLRAIAAEYLSRSGTGGEARFDVIAVMFDRRGHLQDVVAFTDAF